MIGDNIKKYRKEKGYSQERLASELFVVRQTVSKWEKNISVPDADLLEKISVVLNVSVEALLSAPSAPDKKSGKPQERSATARRSLSVIVVVLLIILAVLVLWWMLGTTTSVDVTTNDKTVPLIRTSRAR